MSSHTSFCPRAMHFRRPSSCSGTRGVCLPGLRSHLVGPSSRRALYGLVAWCYCLGRCSSVSGVLCCAISSRRMYAPLCVVRLFGVLARHALIHNFQKAPPGKKHASETPSNHSTEPHRHSIASLVNTRAPQHRQHGHQPYLPCPAHALMYARDLTKPLRDMGR